MPETLQDPLISKLFILAVSFALIFGVTFLLRRMTNATVKDSALRYKLRKIISLVSFVAFAFVAMTIFSEKLTGITVALGVAGAGIAFALQEVIASFAGWVAISVGNFYKVGDRVMMGGITGDVIDISTLRTTLMETGQWVKGDLYNGRIVRISNAFVFKEPVFNFSADFPFLWDEIMIPVKFGSDRRLAREILEKAGNDLLMDYTAEVKESWNTMVRKYLIEDAVLEPKVTMTANDNWIEFTLRYVVDYKFRRSTKDMLYTRILDEVDKSEGRVALASATFHLVELPDLKVHLKRG